MDRFANAMQAAQEAVLDWPGPLHLRPLPNVTTPDQQVFRVINEDGADCGVVTVFLDEGVLRVKTLPFIAAQFSKRLEAATPPIMSSPGAMMQTD